MMKTILLTCCALGALTIGAQAADLGARYNPVTAAPAAQQISGDVTIYGGWMRSDYNGDDFSSGIIGGAGRANVWLNPGMSVQFDLSAEGVNEDSGYYVYGVVNAAAHVSWRNPGYLLGLYGSVGQNSDWEETFATVGVEGQTYLGPITLYGQAGYTFGVSGDWNDDPHGGFVHLEGRYFFNPDLMLSANVGYGHGEYNDGTAYDFDLWRWGAKLEAKLPNSPFGGYLEYQGQRADYNSDDRETSHAFLVGLKLHFNNQSLQSASQAGATLQDNNFFTGANFFRDY
jgi:hypothetical protein